MSCRVFATYKKFLPRLDTRLDKKIIMGYSCSGFSGRDVGRSIGRRRPHLLAKECGFFIFSFRTLMSESLRGFGLFLSVEISKLIVLNVQQGKGSL